MEDANGSFVEVTIAELLNKKAALPVPAVEVEPSSPGAATAPKPAAPDTSITKTITVSHSHANYAS